MWPAVPVLQGRQCRSALGGSAGLVVAAVPALGCLLRLAAFLLLLQFLGALAAFLLLGEFGT